MDGRELRRHIALVKPEEPRSAATFREIVEDYALAKTVVRPSAKTENGPKGSPPSSTRRTAVFDETGLSAVQRRNGFRESGMIADLYLIRNKLPTISSRPFVMVSKKRKIARYYVTENSLPKSATRGQRNTRNGNPVSFFDQNVEALDIFSRLCDL